MDIQPGFSRDNGEPILRRDLTSPLKGELLVSILNPRVCSFSWRDQCELMGSPLTISPSFLCPGSLNLSSPMTVYQVPIGAQRAGLEWKFLLLVSKSTPKCVTDLLYPLDEPFTGCDLSVCQDAAESQ